MAVKRFYTVEKLGPKQSRTNEGFLLCEDVPIARTGTMLYVDGEVPIDGNGTGYIKIHREPEEVFRPETIVSFNGKPAVNDHPDDDVTPDNWNSLAVGVVLNVRRGTGADDDLLLADMLITNSDAIADVIAGKREVSCGYDADYVQVSPGEGRQTNIIGNHVALVESGRCGSRCAIGDADTIKILEKQKMTIKKESPFAALMKKVRDALVGDDKEGAMKALDDGEHLFTGDDDEEARKAADEAEAEAKKAKDASNSAQCYDAVATEARFKSIEDGQKMIMDAIAELKKPATKDTETEEAEAKKVKDAEEAEAKKVKDAEEAEAKKVKDAEEAEAAKMKGTADEDGYITDDTAAAKALDDEAPAGMAERFSKARDSSLMSEIWQNTVATAEILCPGIRFGTFDSSNAPTKTMRQICHLRRKALDGAYKDVSTRVMIDVAVNGKTFDAKTIDCSQIRVIFNTVGMMKARDNNKSAAPIPGNITTAGTGSGLTPADINALNAKFYSGQ